MTELQKCEEDNLRLLTLVEELTRALKVARFYVERFQMPAGLEGLRKNDLEFIEGAIQKGQKP